MMTRLFTIGHSSHSLEEFRSLLRLHGVSAVADVRSMPFSRINPQFNQNILGTFLRKNRTYYVFMGKELGARRDESEVYRDGRACYGLIARTALFRQGLERIREGMQTHRIALMCSEKDPVTCHRMILVARHLRSSSFEIAHILADGSLERTAAAEGRLLDLLRLDHRDLYGGEAEMVERAYDAQAERIAYTRPVDEVVNNDFR